MFENLRLTTLIISFTAAPLGEVMTAIFSGRKGIFFFLSGSNSPSFS